MSQHYENLTGKWSTLLRHSDEIPGVIAAVIKEGGSRPAWNVENAEEQTMLLAWPKESLLRAAVIMHGPKDGRLNPHAPLPFMEGFANALEVADTYPWGPGHLGEVQVVAEGGDVPVWFHDPLFFRDKLVDLSPGVVQTFYVSGLCFGVRRALLDELTITAGPVYEEHAARWLEENPGKARMDVPLMKIPLSGMSVLAPTPRRSEYQGRCRIFDVDSFRFGPPEAEVKVYRFGGTLGSEEHPLHVLFYAPEKVCAGGYVPREGDEIDTVFWMQGRIVDVGDEIAEPTEGKQ